MAPHPAKSLCLAMDAASPELLRRWALDGSLPNLKSLMERGLAGDVAGIEGLFVGSTWPSFYTGMSPARHGFHYLAQLQSGTYSLHLPAEYGISLAKPFWTYLSEAGRRVAVFDVPLSRLDESINGIHVVEWGGHDSVYGFRTHPEALTDTIRRRFGPHPLGPSCDGHRRTAEDYESFLKKLLEGIRRKAELTCHFLRQGRWDFFQQVFTESHCVGHQCWHLHDAAHPAHDPSIVAFTGNPLRRVYEAIDGAVGSILREAGGATVFFFSAHSMGPSFGAHFLLVEILNRLGVAVPVPDKAPATGVRAAFKKAARWGWHKIPSMVREDLTPFRDWVLGQPGSGNALPALGVDPASSLCFAVPNGLAVGGIRLNLKGREPLGFLDPNDADDFSNNLIRDLLAIQDDRTGRPLIRRVRRTRDLYRGAHLDRLPDLLVEWDDTIPTGSTNVGSGGGASVSAFSDKTGSLRGMNDYGRTGEHRPGGIFIAAGTGIRAGQMDRSVSIMDLAPTLSRWLGLELPGTDGRPIPELSVSEL